MDTSASLLDSLRAGSDEQAWQSLVELYSPLVRGWLIRHGAPPADTEDIVQEVLLVVVRRIGEFRRQPRAGAFRTWLRTIAVNCLRDQWRRRGKQPVAQGGTDFGEMIEQLADPHSGLSRLWDLEHDRHVTQFLLQRVRAQVTARNWQAFQRFVLDGLSADDVARELNISANAVFIAKSRVMSSLRALGQGLIDC
jgi:RNA polymerase sigma-70 factor (ECF subfamily)